MSQGRCQLLHLRPRGQWPSRPVGPLPSAAIQIRPRRWCQQVNLNRVPLPPIGRGLSAVHLRPTDLSQSKQCKRRWQPIGHRTCHVGN